MSFRRFFILVEGPDDARFFNAVLAPRLKESFDLVKSVEYSAAKQKFVRGLLRSIKSNHDDYIFVADINNSPCVTAKKAKVLEHYPDAEAERTIVVIKEIESWYLAGLTDSKAHVLVGRTFDSTDEIDKEKFNEIFPKKFSSRIDFMQEVLKTFSPTTAAKKNASFKYFKKKMSL